MNDPSKDIAALFEDIFARGIAERGADHEDELWLTEREAREGCTKRVLISRCVPCLECVELGACATCLGIGNVVDRRGMLMIEQPCPTCRAKPHAFTRCGECVDGLRMREERLDVIVRPDTQPGTRISVLGKGDAAAGRPSGNRYFAIAIERAGSAASHPYRASGNPQGRPRAAVLPRTTGGSPALVFGAMVLIAAGILIAMVYAGH